MEDDKREELKQAWNKLIYDIAKEFHLYDLLDWIKEKLERW